MHHRDELHVIFGDLRQALQGPPGKKCFERACQIIDRASWIDQERTLAEFVPFAAGSTSRWPDDLKELPSRWAMRWLDGDLPEQMAALAGAIEIDGNICLRDEDVDALVALTHLVTPITLEIHVGELCVASFESFFERADMDALTSLTLRGDLDVKRLECLSEVAASSALRELDLSGTSTPRDALLILDRALWAKELTSLHLSSSMDMVPLPECVRLCENLETLSMKWAKLSGDDCLALATSPELTSLKRLRLDECEIGNDGLLALIGSEYLSELEMLSVVGNRIGSTAISRLATSKLIDGVRVLRIGGNPIKGGGLKKLAKSKHLYALEEINIYNLDNELGGVFLQELAKNPVVTSLRKIEANNNRIADEHGEALLERDDLGELEFLEGSFWNLEPETWRALLSSKLGRKIAHLDIIGTDIIDEDETSIFDDMPDDSCIRFFRYETWGEKEGRGALLAMPPFRELEELVLEAIPLGEAVEAFCKPPLTDSIRALRLDCEAIDEDTVVELLESGRLRNIEELELNRCELTERTVDALVNATHIQGLRRISLWNNRGMGDAAARIFSSHHMRSLYEVYLNDVQMSGAALARELDRLTFDSPLVVLGVQSNPLGDEGASALASTPHLPHLGTCYMYACEIGEAGVMAIANSPNFRRTSFLHLGKQPGSELARRALYESPCLTRRVRDRWLPDEES